MSKYGPNRSKHNPSLRSFDGKTIATIHLDQSGQRYALKLGSVTVHKMFKRPGPGFAYDTSALEQARALGVDYFVFRDRETGQEWTATLADFEAFGAPIDFGFGAQTLLHERYWRTGNQPRPEWQPDPFRTQLVLFDITNGSAARRAA